MTLRHISDAEYTRRKIWLETKLWILRLRIRMGSSQSMRSIQSTDTRAPDVLDRLRASQASARKLDALITREEDVTGALITLELTRSPFFGR